MDVRRDDVEEEADVDVVGTGTAFSVDEAGSEVGDGEEAISAAAIEADFSSEKEVSGVGAVAGGVGATAAGAATEVEVI